VVDSINEVNRLPVATAKGQQLFIVLTRTFNIGPFRSIQPRCRHSHLLKSLPTFTPTSSAPESCFTPQPGKPVPGCADTQSPYTPRTRPTAIATSSPSSSTKNAAMVERVKASRILTSFPLRCPSVSGVAAPPHHWTSWPRNLVSLSTLYCMPRDSPAFLCSGKFSILDHDLDILRLFGMKIRDNLTAPNLSMKCRMTFSKAGMKNFTKTQSHVFGASGLSCLSP